MEVVLDIETDSEFLERYMSGKNISVTRHSRYSQSVCQSLSCTTEYLLTLVFLTD
jgi:hypothetical protein